MPNIYCAVTSCKTSMYNKSPGVTFHSCPSSSEMRNKWLNILKNKCTMLDWSKTKLCSKHFENKYFDSQRKLKENAIPTLFAAAPNMNTPSLNKVDRLLNKLTQDELAADIKYNMSRMKEPLNLDLFVNDDLKCKNDAPLEARLWLMIKKQDYLITKLSEIIVQNKKHTNTLQKNLESAITSKKETEHNIETLKYIVKSLQEKHATLEEQIEILTAVESR